MIYSSSTNAVKTPALMVPSDGFRQNGLETLRENPIVTVTIIPAEELRLARIQPVIYLSRFIATLRGQN
jgi:hypothetical protein